MTKKLTTIISLLLGVIALQAQVTVKGALLDLKEETKNDGSADSKKGLGMPRVTLTNLQALTMGEGSDKVEIPNENGQWESHTGLLVYNMNEYSQCDPSSTHSGLYVWTGNEWQGLGIDGMEETRLRFVTHVETSGDDNWNGAVVRHQAKAGVYEEFISADFGEAGRWMTTNLAAMAYDDVEHSERRTLEGPKFNTEGSLNTALWVYPNTGLSPNPDPYLGFLYTWDAATAGKGGAIGNSNKDNPNVMEEVGYSEYVGNGTSPANQQKRRQGICPKGWHLPSDYEWTELEQTIIKNTSMYADMEDINPLGIITDDSWVLQASVAYQGTTHGTAMKSICIPTGSSIDNTFGKSKSFAQGGFNAQATGYAHKISDYYGRYQYVWSSSSSKDGVNNYAWRRGFSTNDKIGKMVYHATIRREYQLSVRCKKD